MRRPSAASVITALSIAAPLALAGCDVDDDVHDVELRSQDVEVLIAEKVYEPTPGGGGCEGCVTCFKRSGLLGGLCLASDARYTGASPFAEDDLDLAKLLETHGIASWQMYNAQSVAMCPADGCASQPAWVKAPGVNTWVALRPGLPDLPPRELAFTHIGTAPEALPWPPGEGLRISVRVGLGATPSVLEQAALGDADRISTPDSVTAAMAHITYPSELGGLVSCSGFVVSPRHLLTAAHCFARDPARSCSDHPVYFGEVPDGLDIRLGGLHSPSHPQFAADIRRAAESIEFHCDPNIDLAVVTLTEPTAAPPLPLAMPAGWKAAVGSPATAYGYGVSRMKASIPGERYDWGRLKRISLAAADLLPGSSESQYLLTYTATSGSIGVCRGDSGGPVVRVIDGQQQAVGVVFARILALPVPKDTDLVPLEPVGARSFAWSRHNACGEEPLQGFVATRVDHPDLHAWIFQRIDVDDPEECELPVIPPAPPVYE